MIEWNNMHFIIVQFCSSCSFYSHWRLMWRSANLDFRTSHLKIKIHRIWCNNCLLIPFLQSIYWKEFAQRSNLLRFKLLSSNMSSRTSSQFCFRFKNLLTISFILLHSTWHDVGYNQSSSQHFNWRFTHPFHEHKHRSCLIAAQTQSNTFIDSISYIGSIEFKIFFSLIRNCQRTFHLHAKIHFTDFVQTHRTILRSSTSQTSSLYKKIENFTEKNIA